MIWFQTGSTQGTQADLYADSQEDITNELEAFGKRNHLKHGSTCMCIDTSAVYIMKTDETWKQV